ncbi:MAG: 8-oxo-dGTP diphosphatase [Nitrososphaerota archaeon]|nr:8-oxo-dGTP diphosphatase [Nitrososphaerota archaeon]
MSSDPGKLLNPPETIRAVLCYLEKKDSYLLLKKAQGRFGGGFWNAPGGKIEPNESPEQAARREVYEETGLTVGSMKKLGSLIFYFGKKQRPDWTAEVFLSKDFKGTIKEGDEGRLEWFAKSSLPYEEMWQDDRHWLPLLVEGRSFRGIFEFSEDSKSLLRASVVEEQV